MTFEEKKNISILMQVAFKASIELAKRDNVVEWDIENIEVATQSHYDMLIRLIERAQAPPEAQTELSMSDISTLERLIDTSTYDDDKREIARKTVARATLRIDYDIIKEKLLANQQDMLTERGTGNMTDIEMQLYKESKNPKK